MEGFAQTWAPSSKLHTISSRVLSQKGKILNFIEIYLSEYRKGEVFGNKSYASEVVVNSNVWAVSGWGSRDREFEDIPLQDINRSWTSIS